MPQKKYYHAYDERYRQIHEQGLKWFHNTRSAIVKEIIEKYSIQKNDPILEIGCGEGRDAIPLLKQGYNLWATDVSEEAVYFCKNALPEHSDSFSVMDCTKDYFEQKFDFIYAVAVIHMLVTDEDRNAFYSFIRQQLSEKGVALICTMGNGLTEFQTDIHTAFHLKERFHDQSGKTVQIVNTSCRTVSFSHFGGELYKNGLTILEQGKTSVPPDFPQMMYAIVKTM